MKPFVLIAEDEKAVAELLRYNLERAGYETTIAPDGDEAMIQLDERIPDLVLLDWMLPKVPGIEVCRRIRSKPETANLPVIMLTARSEEADRIRGLDTGADDYVTKPFSTTELVARVRAVLRRIRPALIEDKVIVGDIIVDRTTHTVADGVWGSDGYVEARTVDVHVGRLRKALMSKGGDDPIRTVRSAGYSLRTN